MARFILLFALAVLLNCALSSGGHLPCDYNLIQMIGFTDKDIVVGTTDIRNQSVYNLLNIHSGKWKRGVPLTISGSTSYFEIIKDEVIVTGCPPVQTTETIEMVLDTQGYSSEPACTFNINLTVVLTEPDIDIPTNSSVSVMYSAHNLDVLNFTLVNEGPCTNFDCSVTCTNGAKDFWIGNGTSMIRTATDNIIFGFVYQVNLNCADMDPDIRATKTSTANVQVSFSGDSSFTFGNYPSTTAVSKSPTTVIQAQLTTDTSSTATSLVLVTTPMPVLVTLLVAVSLHFEP